MSVPLSLLINSIESATGDDFQFVLKNLFQNKAMNTASKAEIATLVGKVMKLLRSHEQYQIWKGLHLTTVLSFSPVILAESNQLLTQVFKIVELRKSSNELLLVVAIKTMITLMNNIRGKPVLTREVLTPKLSAIIGLLIDLVTVVDPTIILPLLKEILYKHTTTFKPFMTRFETTLVNMLSQGKVSSDVCECLAYLHLSGKKSASMPDEHWKTAITSVLGEIKPIVSLFSEFVEMDPEAVKMMELLPAKTDFLPLPSLRVDLNEPMTLLAIPQRLSLLSKILIAFATLPTPFPVRIPLGLLVKVGEIFTGLSSNFVPLKREMRDPTLKKMIHSIMFQTQACGVELFTALIQNFGKMMLPHLHAVSSSLEVMIPLKDKSINYEEINSTFLTVFNCAKLMLALETVEVNVLAKLVDIAVFMMESQSLVDNMFDAVKASSVAKKTKKSKDSTPLADIMSHVQLFQKLPLKSTSTSVNLFLNAILKNTKLPSTQQVKVIKYAITFGLMEFKTLGNISDTLTALLQTIVLNPGNERISILPIAVNIMPNDIILNLLANPRLPPPAIKQQNVVIEPESEEEEEEEEQQQEKISVSQSTESVAPVADVFTPAPVAPVGKVEVDKSKLFTETQSVAKRTREEIVEPVEAPKKAKIETVQPVQQEESDDDDEELVIPDIELSDDE